MHAELGLLMLYPLVHVYTMIIRNGSVHVFSCTMYSLRYNFITDASIPHLVGLMETARKFKTFK
jgi:hypothetical protein